MGFSPGWFPALFLFLPSQKYSSTAEELQASWEDRTREVTCPRSPRPPPTPYSKRAVLCLMITQWTSDLLPASLKSVSWQGCEDILSKQLDSPKEKNKGTELDPGSSIAGVRASSPDSTLATISPFLQ